jgi:hypothetical protein
MIKANSKWWLAVALLCLAPVALSAKQDQNRDKGCDHSRRKDCQQVPEGGSAAIYVLGAGVTCLGAMFIRSRASKPSLS